jgi:hypothetical protein
MYILYLAHFCGIPLAYKKEAPWPEEGTIGKMHSFVGFFMFVGADDHISNYVHRFKNRRM